MAQTNSFFVTTPIFYVNDVPHIGHAYTQVAADVLARWHRQRGDRTWFLTGTDEHGEKILRTATANSMSPKEWADRLVATAWHPLLSTINITNDDFIRTTDARHEENVQKFLQQLHDENYIYAGEYEAWYCVGCEEFKPESEIVKGEGVFEGEKVCAIHSKPLELLQEKNYFFKLSAFGQKLLDLYAQNPDFIQPESARNEVIAFVQQGLDDLSISRTSFDWGIPIPWDSSHVTYVWFDALLNYITAAGYGQDDAAFASRWPATHIVGKDILRFHAVIWPAMLMAAGIEVPKQVFGHGWLLVGGEKMSKSKLTGIAPQDITETFGSDAFRYYFMRAISFGHDGSFSWEDLAARYQAELANGFGNLASRTLAMNAKYFGGVVPEPSEYSDADLEIKSLVLAATDDADHQIQKLQIHEALASIWQIVDALNGYITEQEPWVLAKSEETKARLATVLYTVSEGLRSLAILLAPVIPEASEKLWRALGLESALGQVSKQRISEAGVWGVTQSGTAQQPLEPLFPRIETED